MILKVDDRVKVLDNAFEGSNDPTDFEARGKLGTVVWIGDNGCIEVQTDDDDYLPLTTDEVEVISD